MALADWDEVLLWLRENGAPRWAIKRREEELREKERIFERIDARMRRRAGLNEVNHT